MVLVTIGPFGTDKSLSFAERLLYWGVEATATFFCGVFAGAFSQSLLRQYITREWLIIAISGLFVSIPIGIIVTIINITTFGAGFATTANLTGVALNCLLISFAITVIYNLITGRPGQTFETPNPTHSKFFDRIPLELGKNLLHLSSQDHYVEATTDRGSTLVLLRFSDAIDELDPDLGMRIHRAYWVSFAAINKTRREDGKLLIETADGKTFPVSRTYIKDVRTALNL